jgi:dynein heavy chain
MKRLIEEEPELNPTISYVFRDPILFGDYRNALEVGEPRIYEDLQDYEASKALFEQVSIIKNSHFY